MSLNQSLEKYKFDCLHFRGYKPCAAKKLCVGCNEYAPRSKKILIIKLGALGDVLRTTPVLHAFHRRDPRAHITWITKSNARDMLGTTPFIHRLIAVDDADNGAVLRLMVEEFDELHCYDKEDAAIALASLVKAKQKFGFHMNAHGHMAPINQGSVYSFDLGLSDEMKFVHNQKTYQQLTYESSDLPVPLDMDPYEMPLLVADRHVAQSALESRGLGARPIVGLNTGSGRVFQTKQWLESHFEALATLIKTRLGADVLLMGGRDEHERNLRLQKALGSQAHYLGCDYTIRQFAALLERCAVTVTGDTLAMHLALTVKTPTVALFGSTCDQEVDLYGLGEKIVSRPRCAPCYKNNCNLEGDAYMACMAQITPIRVLESVQRLLEKQKIKHVRPDTVGL
jgi:heptosyltransferase-2